MPRRILPRALVAAALVTATLIPVTASAGAEPRGDRDAVAQAIAQLPAYVRRVMRETGVPGVAVAVVHRDRLVYAKGFGVRSTASGKPVTANTVFQVASVSKPLGATAVAAAIGEGTLSWDTPAAPLLPGFSLADPWVTDNVTIGDLYAHRSGLPKDFGNDLEQLGFGRRHILERAHLEPLSPFRISYAYSNFGLTAGGIAAANAADQSWTEFTRQRIFEPLGMSRSTYSHAALERMSNVATLHQKVKGQWVAGPSRNAVAQAPAGAANSTVRDISRWMRMVLGKGVFRGERIVAEDPLTQMLSLQVRFSPDPVDRIAGYGFGIQTTAIANEPIVFEHAGDFSNGASTQVYLVPELDLGIVTLTNGWPSGAPQAINVGFADLVRFGRLTADWPALYAAAFAPLTTPTYSIDGQRRPDNPVPARSLTAYAGSYSNDYVGNGQVVLERGRLVLSVGPNGATRIPLRHWSGDVFFYNEPTMPTGFYSAVRFAFNGPGSATSLTIHAINSGLGVLERTPS